MQGSKREKPEMNPEDYLDQPGKDVYASKMQWIKEM